MRSEAETSDLLAKYKRFGKWAVVIAISAAFLAAFDWWQRIEFAVEHRRGIERLALTILNVFLNRWVPSALFLAAGLALAGMLILGRGGVSVSTYPTSPAPVQPAAVPATNRIHSRPVAKTEDGTEIIASWQMQGAQQLKLALRNVAGVLYRFRCRVRDPHGFVNTAQPQLSEAIAYVTGARPSTVYVQFPKDFHGAEALTPGLYSIMWELLSPLGGGIAQKLGEIAFSFPSLDEVAFHPEYRVILGDEKTSDALPVGWFTDVFIEQDQVVLTVTSTSELFSPMRCKLQVDGKRYRLPDPEPHDPTRGFPLVKMQRFEFPKDFRNGPVDFGPGSYMVEWIYPGTPAVTVVARQFRIEVA